jgi:RNA polymerase primary sigma factor
VLIFLIVSLYLAGIKVLLSYFNEQALGITELVSEANETTRGTETSNIEVARRLEAAKLKLINTLAEFPVTALWVVDKYWQHSIPSEQTSEVRVTSELRDALVTIKSAIQWGDKQDSDKKLTLINALRSFPFSFEDLIELTDIIVHAFQTRGLCYSAKHPHIGKRANWVIKRLQALKRLGKSTLLDKLNALQINQEDFLSDEALYQHVIDAVFAEHFWLTARRQLVENNAKLVLFIAHQYKGGFLELDDVIQEGQTGLLKAVDKFDYRLGFQFSTYAAYWIRQRILRASSRGGRVVRVPCEQVGNINKLFRAKDALWAKTGKEPSVAALAAYLKMTDDEINTILSIAQTTVSLENFDTDDENTVAPIDIIEQQVFESPFEQIAQSELESWLELAVKTLDPREYAIVCSHFGINANSEMTLQEIGTQLNISRERVRQIQVMAFNKMKAHTGEQLMSFL